MCFWTKVMIIGICFHGFIKEEGCSYFMLAIWVSPVLLVKCVLDFISEFSLVVFSLCSSFASWKVVGWWGWLMFPGERKARCREIILGFVMVSSIPFFNRMTAFCFLFANYKLWWASALVGLNGKNVVFFSCLLCVFLLISVI